MDTNETLAALREALAKAADPALAKAWTQSASATSGLTAYDLEAPAKTLYPVLTPLRNEIPRVGGGMGIQANWRAITGINTASVEAGVSQGNRGGVITTSTADYLAAYKGIGLEDYVTFEAEYAARGFDDVKARATQGLLRSLMIQEESIILGGNTSVALGTTPTPTIADITTGGTLAANTAHRVICVALSYQGFRVSNVTSGVVASVTRTNADGSSDTYGGGAAQQSAAASVTTANDSNATHGISAYVTPVRGAFAYAWFLGTTAGTERLISITTLNSARLMGLNGSGQLASALPGADNSTNTYVFDGLLSQIAKSGSNAYYAAQATGTPGTGTPLTADTSGAVEEFDLALKSFWDNWRLSPSEIWVSSQEMGYLRKKVLTGAATMAQRFIFQATQGGLIGGSQIRGYINPYTMGEAEMLPIRMHPNLPAGVVMFLSKTLPYTLSGVTNVNQIRTRQEYYQLEWPMRSRKYEYGVYADEVLQCYAPFSMGMITNIAPG
jgi:hypothetical protein